MDSTNFIYWLQGYLELSNAKSLTTEQVTVIKQHIALVMEKRTDTNFPIDDSLKTILTC